MFLEGLNKFDLNVKFSNENIEPNDQEYNKSLSSNTFSKMYLRGDTVAFWNMYLLDLLTQLTHQITHKEKTFGEVLLR